MPIQALATIAATSIAAEQARLRETGDDVHADATSEVASLSVDRTCVGNLGMVTPTDQIDKEAYESGTDGGRGENALSTRVKAPIMRHVVCWWLTWALPLEMLVFA